jgi:hypothetical protein
MLGKLAIGAVSCPFSWYLRSEATCGAEIPGASDCSERVWDRKTRRAIVFNGQVASTDRRWVHQKWESLVEPERTISSELLGTNLRVTRYL